VEKYCRAGQSTDDNIIRRMRFAFWITEATDMHSECVMPIAFPLQQWLHERASMLRYTYSAACLVHDFVFREKFHMKPGPVLNWYGTVGTGRSRMMSTDADISSVVYEYVPACACPKQNVRRYLNHQHTDTITIDCIPPTASHKNCTVIK
jgi:hypothetical protein